MFSLLLLLLLLQAALKQFSQRHAYIMPYMDDGVCARISALPLKKAMLVVKALDETGRPAGVRRGWEGVGPCWEGPAGFGRCRSEQSWHLGVFQSIYRRRTALGKVLVQAGEATGTVW
jgi:hypothetical protein